MNTVLYHDRLRIPASLEELHHVYSWAEEQLLSSNIEESKRFDIMLALSEAVTNAIRHGSSERPSDVVDIDVEITTTAITIKVHDKGSGFDPHSLPDPTQGPHLYVPNGRGVYLIRTLADTVEFNFNEDGTTVVVAFQR